MKHRLRFAAAAAAALLLAQPALGAGDAQAGKAKAQACAACHGLDGKSPNPQWPHLAGQVPGYIAKQLAAFKSGTRKDSVMSGIAAKLSEQDMADLDAYYSELPPTEGTATDLELAKKGERLYRGGNRDTGVAACMGCHGPAGHGIPPHFPRVSGQNMAYLEKALLAFKRGERKDEREIMSRIAFFMSEEEIKAVAQYMHGLE